MSLVTLTPSKTYASHANALAAVRKVFGAETELRYLVLRDEPTGRYFPVFLGDDAVQAGAHFHFHVVG